MVSGLLCWRDSHPLEWQLASLNGVAGFAAGGSSSERKRSRPIRAFSATPRDGQRPCRTLAEDPGRTQPRAAYRRVGEDVCHPHPPQTRTCRIPASGSSQESLANGDIAMDDPGPRKRVAGEEGSELLPWEWCRAGPSLQPFPPGPFSLEGILEQLPNVPRDTVVRVVAA